MTSVTIAVFVHDRYEHTKLCLSWLDSSLPVADFEFNLLAVDDFSEDRRIAQLLEDYCGLNVMHTRPCASLQTPQERIGCARCLAVNAFLDFGKDDYLLLLDNDIIVTKATIAEAIQDYELLLAQGKKLGGYTLFPFTVRKHMVSKDCLVGSDKAWGFFTLGGEAHMLFKREDLKRVGNHFSASPGGFGDVQIQAILKDHSDYASRIEPLYQIQHIGFGEGASTCHNGRRKFSWLMRPYTNPFNQKVLQIEGFDVSYYEECVNKVGSTNAPQIYTKVKGIPYGNERQAC